MLGDNQTLHIRELGSDIEVHLITQYSNTTFEAKARIENWKVFLNCKTTLLMRLEAAIIYLQKKTENAEAQ